MEIKKITKKTINNSKIYLGRTDIKAAFVSFLQTFSAPSAIRFLKKISLDNTLNSLKPSNASVIF